VAASAQEIVTALFAAFSERDVEKAIALSDPEGELWLEGTAGRTGRSGPYRGAEGLREYFADLGRVWEEITVMPGDLRVAGGGVVSFGRVRIRAIGETETVELPVIWVFKLRNSRVLSARVVATAAEAERRLAESQADAPG
jgi:ketosteroid isomerase-like protein